MKEPHIAHCENRERLQALYRYEILDTPPEELFDEFTRMAATVCKAPVAVLNFLDKDRQWFKSEIGLGVRETPLDVSICKHAILLEKELFVIPDTLADERTRANPVVTAHNGLRFYAGAVLRTDEGHAIGTLCVLDHKPRDLAPEQTELLRFLAKQIMNRLDLQLERTRFAHAVNSFTECFFSINSSLRILHLNPAAARILDDSPDADPKGIRIVDLPGFEESHVFVQNCRKSLDRHESRFFECAFPATGRWMEVALYPSVEGLTVCAKDITDSREDRRQIHLLQTCVQNLNDLVLITRAEPLEEPGPEIIYVNSAFEKLTGYSREDILGKNPRILQGPDTDRATLDRIRTAISNGESIREEILNYSKNGTEYWLEMEIQPVRDTEGSLTYFIAIERDITERKRLQQRMLRAHRLEGLGALAGGLAHEVNNMLTPVLMAANMLENSVSSPENKQLLTTIETGVSDAAEVIRSVLAYARGIGGDRVRLSPMDVVEELPLLVERTTDNRVNYQMEAAPDLPRFTGDPEQIEAVVDQLADNACAAMPAGGTLTLSIRLETLDGEEDVLHEPVKPGTYIVFTFSDTGPGIPDDLRDRVFEPFFTTKPFGTASGLGLPFVLGVLRGHGGFLRMTDAPEGGLQVSACFPADAPPSETTSTPSSPHP